MKTKVQVVNNSGDDAIGKNVLADCIVEISAAFRKLLASGLNRRAVVVLLQDKTSVRKGDIDAVLDGLDGLAGQYTSKVAK